MTISVADGISLPEANAGAAPSGTGLVRVTSGALDATAELSGDVTTAGTLATTLATVNANVGTFGSATQSLTTTVNGKGLVTAMSAHTVTPAIGSITGLGTGVATALAVNVGTAGAPVVLNGALGTPSSGTLTNATGLPPAGVVGTAAVLGANTFTATQTITEAVGSSALVLTGATQTSSFPVLNATQTWNAAGTTFTGMKFNVTDTASAAASLLMDLQVGGASKFAASKGGVISGGGGTTAATIDLGATSSNETYIGVGGDKRAGMRVSGGTNAWVIASDHRLAWSATNNASSGTLDAFVLRAAAATLQLGAAAAAAPVAQTLQAQGSRSGTDTNTGGANYTITSGNGTGTGTISSLILQSPVAVGSGSGAQTQTTGLAIKAGTAVLTSYIVANLPAAATAGAGATAFVTDASTTLILGLGGAVAGGGANKVPVYSDGTNWLYG